MQQWQYCVITWRPKTHVITGFVVQGSLGESLSRYLWTTEDKKLPGRRREGLRVMEAIVELGAYGWEMVSFGLVDEEIHCIYFKRPRELYVAAHAT